MHSDNTCDCRSHEACLHTPCSAALERLSINGWRGLSAALAVSNGGGKSWGQLLGCGLGIEANLPIANAKEAEHGWMMGEGGALQL